MFTTPCFIRKNTPELRNKLEELGYLPPSKLWHDENFAICAFWRDNNGEYLIYKIDDDFERIIAPNYPFIDCGDNEDLFLALAALRDDTDKWQLFVFDGIDVPDYFLQKGDMWICSLDKHLVENCHKATVEEIIEHFKEEQDMENYKIGSKVKHKTRGVIETVVGECKIKIDDEWVEGVIYEGIDYNTGCLMKFVRTKDDFINNFELYEI